MRTGRLPIAITLAGTVALAACSGGGGSAAPATTSAPSATTAATSLEATSTTLATTTTVARTTTTVRELTVQELASIIAKSARDLREGAATVESCYDEFETCPIVDQLGSINFAQTVYVLSLELQTAEKQGTVPASLASLVEDTKGVAAQLKLFLGDDPIETMGCGPGSSATPEEKDGCRTTYLLVLGAADDMLNVLDGWKVYGTES